MSSIKTDPIVEENLFSGELKTVLAAVQTIKEKGNKLYIPLLFDLLNAKPEKEIADEVAKLLSTVKDKAANVSFVEAVKEEKYKPIRKLILTACWQNGLDFSSFLPNFIDVIIHDNWENAFEAFTVIDNLENLPEPKTVEQVRIKIEEALGSANEQKAYFLDEILTKLK